jgi:hypothetical protein
MLTMGEIWHLHAGGRIVAELHVTDPDFPWLNAIVVRKDGFGAIAPLFEDEIRQLERMGDEETPEWTAVYERIRVLTRLTYPDGRDVPEYLLHIDGDEAWWRWSDEPFDKTAGA